jgi:Tfp pilus assembly protein PilN
MVEPLAAMTTGAIAQLAFNEFVKSGAGELAKKSLSGAIDSVKELRKRIQARFKGNDRAETALAEFQQQGTNTALDKVTKYLDIEMAEDEVFATEIRQLAQQINIQNQNTTNQASVTTIGRDQINIDHINGNSTKIGGS